MDNKETFYIGAVYRNSNIVPTIEAHFTISKLLNIDDIVYQLQEEVENTSINYHIPEIDKPKVTVLRIKEEDLYEYIINLNFKNKLIEGFTIEVFMETLRDYITNHCIL